MRPVLPAGMTQPAAQGGRTSTRVHTVVQPPWGRRRQRPVARRCAGRSPSMYGMFDPLGADDDGRATLRGFAALTHGYRVVRPLRGRLPVRPCGVRPVARRCTGRAGMRPVIRRCAVRDATRDTTMCRAGCDPWHDDVPCGVAAPWGPNYSITAGEHGEPAEEQPPPIKYVPKGGEHPRPCGSVRAVVRPPWGRMNRKHPVRG